MSSERLTPGQSKKETLLGKPFQNMYAEYYQHGATLKKREISARQTIDCMKRVVGDCTFDRLLDVGAGEGSVLLQASRSNIARDLFAAEISESGVRAINSKQISRLAEVRLFDGYQIPYPDKYFDIAIAIHVLEHVEHERLFLREIARVARKLYIEVPLEHGLKISRSIETGKKFGHINFYMCDTLRSLLESSGLRVNQCAAIPSSAEYEMHLSGTTKGRIKNFIRKGALSIAPKLAPWFMAYNGYALCDCD